MIISLELSPTLVEPIIKHASDDDMRELLAKICEKTGCKYWHIESKEAATGMTYWFAKLEYEVDPPRWTSEERKKMLEAFRKYATCEVGYCDGWEKASGILKNGRIVNRIEKNQRRCENCRWYVQWSKYSFFCGKNDEAYSELSEYFTKLDEWQKMFKLRKTIEIETIIEGYKRKHL